MGRHARGRGLAMGPSHGHAAASIEDASEARGSGNDGYRAPPGFQKFGVRGGDGGGDYHLFGVTDLMGVMPDVHRHAHFPEPLSVRRLLEVGPGDLVPAPL